MNKDNTALACLGLIALMIAGIFVSALMNGYVLSILWGWFVSPLFGLPTLSVVKAIGFSLVIGMLTKQSKQDNKTSDKDISTIIAELAELIVYSVISPLFTLFIGWIVKLYI